MDKPEKASVDSCRLIFLSMLFYCSFRLLSMAINRQKYPCGYVAVVSTIFIFVFVATNNYVTSYTEELMLLL